MKSLTVLGELTGICVIVVSLSACTNEQLRRTTYDTLKATERQRCLNEVYSDCPRQGGYGEYQQQRESELKPTSTE